MTLRQLRTAGHWPTLVAAFFYFDVSFCVWYLLGPLGNFVSDDLALTASQKGFLVATPLLGGSLFRIVMGVLTALFNPRTQRWHDHFKWSADGTQVVGLTPCGRATVVALQLNNLVAIKERK